MGKRRRKLYVHARPGAMDGHAFTDDVAICRARSRKEAVETFGRLYGLASRENVSRVRFGPDGVAILTDY